MASRSPVAIRAISVASAMSRRALGLGANRAQAAVPSTAAVSVLYISISPWCGSPRSIAVLRKTTGESPMGFSDVTDTVRPNLARPVSRGINIVDLGGAVHCAWVLRDSLVVGYSKRRLRNDAGCRGQLGA